MVVTCCEYEKNRNPNKGRREVLCTTNLNCPTRYGYTKVAKWNAPRCQDCRIWIKPKTAKRTTKSRKTTKSRRKARRR